MLEMSYETLLKDPRWQRKRLEILSRDGFECKICFDTEKTLHVHHINYNRGCKPWEYDDCDLTSLCEDCHESVEELIRKIRDQIFNKNAALDSYDQLAANIGVGLACESYRVLVDQMNKKAPPA